MILMCAIRTLYCWRFIDAIYTLAHTLSVTRQRCASSDSYLTKSMQRLTVYSIQYCTVIISKLRLQFGARCRLAFCQFHVIREMKKNGTSLTLKMSVPYSAAAVAAAGLVQPTDETAITGFGVCHFLLAFWWFVRLSIL